MTQTPLHFPPLNPGQSRMSGGLILVFRPFSPLLRTRLQARRGSLRNYLSWFDTLHDVRGNRFLRLSISLSLLQSLSARVTPCTENLIPPVALIV